MSEQAIKANLPKLHSARCPVHGFWIGKGKCQSCKRTREQRRYEIAKDVFAQMAGSEAWDMVWSQSAEVAVTAADALLKALEESRDAG